MGSHENTERKCFERGKRKGWLCVLPRTTLLVPLMVYESKSFLPGLVFAMRSANPNRRIDNGPLPWRAEIYGLLSPLLPLSIVRSRDEGSLSLESRKRRCGCCHHYSVMSCKESRRRVAAVGEPRTTVWLLPPLLSLCHVKSHNEGPLPLESRERRCRHCHHCSHGLL
ncbi:hypothetical protein DEO72_LG3g1122 [Vigna unguiculata]|uniref:Uncharacterized protein n=1 Tax=Vigna unguiculata TaxID=3917 RepID=A0A4D6LDK5_VIGUN|nr:hypothetical protein DEO72_LG3g1122 [Vigna unguiculata]